MATSKGRPARALREGGVLQGNVAAARSAGSTSEDARWIDMHEDDLDEAQMAEWIRQAAAIPGWNAGKDTGRRKP